MGGLDAAGTDPLKSVSNTVQNRAQACEREMQPAREKNAAGAVLGAEAAGGVRDWRFREESHHCSREHLLFPFVPALFACAPCGNQTGASHTGQG